ncbi:MAG: hypothetical protein KDK34_09230, partial [Leptospiraceae bacterium]|nr:hypothetical protein [Leptospiraceae bacterium]
ERMFNEIVAHTEGIEERFQGAGHLYERAEKNIEGIKSEIHELRESALSALTQKNETLLEEQREDVENRRDRLHRELDEKINYIEEHLAGISESIEQQIGEFTDERDSTRQLMSQMEKEREKMFAAFKQELEKTGKRFHGELNKLVSRYQQELDKRLERTEAEEGKVHTELNRTAERVNQDQARLREEMDRLLGKVRTAIDSGTDEIQGKAREASHQLGEYEEQFEQDRQAMDERLEELVGRFQEELDQRANDFHSEQDQKVVRITESINRAFESRMSEFNDYLQEVNRTRERMEDFAERVRKDVMESQELSVAELEKRARNFLDEQDDKLARISETIDEKINRQLVILADRGQLQIEELEKRTGKTIAEAVTRMEGDLDQARLDFQKLRSEITDEMESARLLKEEVIAEIERDSARLNQFENKLLLVNKAEELVESLDETLEVLNDRLSMAREENSRLDEYVRNFETVRQTRKELDSELRLLESQRGRLSEAENHFERMEARIATLQTEFGKIGEAEEIARTIEKRVHQFNDFKKSFEKYFNELGDRKTFIESAMQQIESARSEVDDSTDVAGKLLERVERAEMRQNHLNDYLKEMESRATGLSRMEDQIQTVEARFEQMDGLMMDL